MCTEFLRVQNGWEWNTIKHCNSVPNHGRPICRQCWHFPRNNEISKKDVSDKKMFNFGLWTVILFYFKIFWTKIPRFHVIQSSKKKQHSRFTAYISKIYYCFKSALVNEWIIGFAGKIHRKKLVKSSKNWLNSKTITKIVVQRIQNKRNAF